MLVRTQVVGQQVNENEEVLKELEDVNQDILNKGIDGKSKGDVFFEAWHLAVNSDLTDEEAWRIYSKGNVNI
jgi:chaperonin cofactor prefoldin